MPKTKVLTGEELVNHYGLIRLRVKGSGNLRLTLYSFDKLQSNILNPLVMNDLTSIEPTLLSNFTQQRAKLQITTTNSGEVFQISKVIIFIKPVAKSYPM